MSKNIRSQTETVSGEMPEHVPGRLERIPLYMLFAFLQEKNLQIAGDLAAGLVGAIVDVHKKPGTDLQLANHEPLTMDYVLDLFVDE